MPANAVVRVDYFDRRKRGHVVRTFRDYCHRLAPRVFAVELGVLSSDMGGYVHLHRNVRIILHLLPDILESIPGYRDRRVEDNHKEDR